MGAEGTGGWVPDTSRPGWWTRLWAPFWAVPVAASLAAVVLGLALPALDRVAWRWVPVIFDGGPDGARSVLGSITSAMISVTGLVFSITMVVLQLASSQFTPRVLGSFLDSRITQATLGVFAGTFLYALTVLRSVRSPVDGGDGFVPQLATGAAYLLVVASVGCFLAFIHHITSSIQVVQVISRTSEATRTTMDRMIPADQEETATRGRPPRWEPGSADHGEDVLAQESGYLTDVDYRALVDLAREHDVVVTLDRQVGDHVVAGTRLGRVWRTGAGSHAHGGLDAEVLGLLVVGRDRSLRQDVAFGVRQLVDIAERALSPGVNDPTTATQAVDALHTVLRPLVQRPVPSAHVTDDDGRVRLVYRPQTVEQLLRLAVVEIAHWGADSVQVPPRLWALLDDLADVALPQYRPTLAGLRADVDRRASEEEPA